MTSNAELVSIWVSKVRAIVIGMVLRAKPWRAFAGAAILQGNLMCRSDRSLRSRCEGNHLPIPGVMWLPVMRLANDKEWAFPTGAVPSGPRLLVFTESQFDTEAVHHGAVEVQGAVEVAHAHEDMRKHIGSLTCLKGGNWLVANFQRGPQRRENGLPADERRGQRVH